MSDKKFNLPDLLCSGEKVEVDKKLKILEQLKSLGYDTIEICDCGRVFITKRK